MQQKTFSVQPDQIGRVDRFVAEILQKPRSWARGLISVGYVRVHGKPCEDPATSLNAGDQVDLRFDLTQNYREKAKPKPPRGFGVIHRDDHLILVNKDAGILTVPTEQQEKNSLVGLLDTYLQQGKSRNAKVHTVHRLDRDTSGLLVFGFTRTIANDLIAQFAAKKPKREYIAIVAGVVKVEKGTIETRLQSDGSLNQKSAEEGELSITHFEVISKFKDSTLLRLNLETGRRNQIRVHMSEMGHPVLGDRRYSPERAKHRLWPYHRLALHARSLEFIHPVTKEVLSFVAEPPSEFSKFQAFQRH